ncbi:hypothetical protein HW555_007942 [Spodoptera exigua]|uniref:FLYWCH-type domain-containing protein n=1 Tax=Spodoptera exigua TaxID=7107 RepID=A0A835GDU8_SPOEX|nr:hypothetical protein HW555_007942 [Spodoptera exigua]
MMMGALNSNVKSDLHFIQTKSGHLQLIYEPYIFVTDSFIGMCTNSRLTLEFFGCGLILNGTGTGEAQVCYTVTRRGAPSLLVDGFGFVARKRRGPRVYWTCRSRAQGCPARALTTDGRLVARAGSHTHERHAPAIDEHARIEIEFVISNRGRRHMRLDGFSFYAEKVFPEKNKVRWRCTRRTCRAYAHTLHDRIFALSNVHSHEPPTGVQGDRERNSNRGFTNANFAAQAKAVLDE